MQRGASGKKALPIKIMYTFQIVESYIVCLCVYIDLYSIQCMWTLNDVAQDKPAQSHSLI